MSVRKKILFFCGILVLTGCGPKLPPSKPASEFTPQEANGATVFTQECARCHSANTQRTLHGPGLLGLYKLKYLPSGAPANDDRVTAVILQGRGMMPGLGNQLNDQQLADLITYLHTL
jgi:mono/diheme cytochrome c family protein